MFNIRLVVNNRDEIIVMKVQYHKGLGKTMPLTPHKICFFPSTFMIGTFNAIRKINK